MRMMKHIQTWLLITLLALSASGIANAKLASGHQNLGSNLHQSQTVLNALLHQGLEQVSTTETSESPLATKGGGNNLFRVVDDVELSDIQKTGAFRSPAGTLEEGKQFVDNIGDAKALQSKFSKFFGGNQTIVGARAPQSVLNNSTKQPFADIPKGQAITVPVKDLPKVTPNL